NPSSKAALLLVSVISNAPSLQVAYQLQKKVAIVGFDWEAVQDIWDKLTEEKAEFLEALEEVDTLAMEEEFGDMLFVLANIAEQYQINPEVALARVNQKFISRFNEVERQVMQSGKDVKDVPLKELD